MEIGIGKSYLQVFIVLFLLLLITKQFIFSGLVDKPTAVKYSNKIIKHGANSTIKNANVNLHNYTKYLSFLHMKSHTYCRRIFSQDIGNTYKQSVEFYYKTLAKEHDLLLEKYDRQLGSSKNYEEETFVMWHLARLPFVTTVCETGFNAGYSTHLWLLANPQVHVYSFDLGVTPYCKEMAEFLKKRFPNRLTVTWGDSTQTLPKFIAENPQVKCDLMVIDGGHTYAVARSDRQNFQKLSSEKENIIFIDNYPDLRQENKLAPAWEEAVRTGEIATLFSCHYDSKNQGFTFGRFIK